MPLAEHTAARHAACATRLLAFLLRAEGRAADGAQQPVGAPLPAPWLALAALLLRHASPDLHPARTLLSATLSTRDEAAQGVLRGVAHQPFRLAPGPLCRMAVALQALGQLAGMPGEPGDPAPASNEEVAAWLRRTSQHAVPVAQFATSLGWTTPDQTVWVRPCAGAVRVRAFTALLLADTLAERRLLHAHDPTQGAHTH